MLCLRCPRIALLLLIPHLASCYSWRATTISPRQVIEEERPERVRVTRLDSNREEVIRNPIVANDSIATTERGCQEDVERRAQTCTITPVMLLSEVASLDVGRQSGFLTGIAVMMGVFFAAAMIGSAAVKPF